MNFLTPLSLAFLGLLPVIVLLYFLKLKRREEVISSTYLWRQAIMDLRVNAPFQRLRKNLLLWLQLALLALMVLGLARPAMNTRGRGGKRYICLVDTSAGMAARDADPDRIATAKREARRLVGDMSRDDQMMLMTFDVRPRVLVPFTTVKSRLNQAIDSIRVRETSTDFGRAVELVKAFARDMPNTHLYLLSDGAFDASAAADVPEIEFSYVRCGVGSRNLGITALDSRRSVEEWDQPQIFARVENFGRDPVSARLDLYLNDTLFDARSLTVPPGESAAAVFSDPALTEGLVRVVLDTEDDLDTDNRAWLVLTPPKPVRTLVVTEGNYFLELAVQKDVLCSPVLMSPEEFDTEVETGAFVAGDYDMVILDRHAPKSLPPGSYLFFAALPPLPSFDAQGDAERPVVIDWDTVHPVNQYVSYANLFIESAMRMSGPPDATTLVESDAGPLVLWWASPTHRLVVVGFDMFSSRWPLRVSFPVFLANAVRYLGGGQLMGEGGTVRPGEVISFPAPPDATHVELTCPGGEVVRLPVRSGRISFADTTLCGPYSFQVYRNQATTYVVNLLDSRESNIMPAESVPWRKATVAGVTKALKENREVWPWLVLAALAVLMLEWYIYHRRVYV